ncbi:hypothetical protein LIA77_10165 [Sarocladium implicatum]|nr:hypothetical protein LIA77_10165 [Sarocladium implicatum]
MQCSWARSREMGGEALTSFVLGAGAGGATSSLSDPPPGLVQPHWQRVSFQVLSSNSAASNCRISCCHCSKRILTAWNPTPQWAWQGSLTISRLGFVILAPSWR